MVDEKPKRRCKECPCQNGRIWEGMVFCYFRNCDVWADSLMCYWGETVADSF